MVRVQSAAGVSPSISVQSGKSALRRDLRQQASRFALMSAIGLAAAAGGSLMTPGEALADCVVVANTVRCGTTTTTNTTYPNSQPNDRAYQVVSGTPMTGAVSTDATVSGHGLSLTNNGTGGLDVVNNGTIRGDAADFVSGAASLLLASSEGDLRYSGSGDVIGDEDAVSDGIVAIQTGTGVIDLDIGGTVRGVEGVTATGTGAGAVNVTVRGAVSGIFDAGVHATGAKAVTVTVDGSVEGYYDGVAATTSSNTQDDVTVRGAGSIHAAGGAAINIFNNGNGRAVIDFDGAVTNELSDGISVRDRTGSGDIDIDVRSVAADAAGISVFQDGYGSTSINVDEDVSGGYVGVSVISVPAQGGPIDINIGGAVTAEAGIEVLRYSASNLNPIRIAVGGPITATAGDGVNLVARGDMSVAVGDITASGDGIDIRTGNNGATNISITGSGDIVAQGGRGITVLNEWAQTVDIVRQGSITGTDGDAIHIRNTVAIAGDVNVEVGSLNATGTDQDGGAADGIDVSYTSNVANLNLIANGDIQADGNGVSASLTSAAATGDIDVTTRGAVRGAMGVFAVNNGSGDVSITAGGPVTGTTNSGIFAQSVGGAISVAAGDVTGQAASGITVQLLNAPTSTNGITVTADNVVGRSGLFASNSGLGTLSITTTGDVTGTIGEGMLVSSVGDIEVAVGGVVTGATQGLLAQSFGNISVTGGGFTGLNGNAVDIDNQGPGEVNFEATGPITASNGHGVYVRDNPAGGDITVTTGAVSAEDGTFSGIDIASSSLTADVTVVANGAVRAGESGIEARLAAGTSGNIDLTANGSVNGRQGIFALSSGSGAVAVTATGQVTAGSGAGVLARSSGGDVTVNVTDVSSVSGIGVSADQSEATGAGDVSISAGAVSGSQGILASNRGTGTTSITASGPVTGNGAAGIGIQAFGRNDLSVATGGLVTGATRGMVLLSSLGGVGDISVTGSGGVTALDGNGVEIDNNGAGSVTFQNSGPITATNGHGVVVRDTPIGGDISITTGAVTANSATYDGIQVISNSTTANISVVANGDIQAGAYGIDLTTDFGSLGNIDITANGSITGGGGIYAEALGAGSVNVTAVGPVTVTNEYGILATAIGGGDVTVNAGDVTSAGSSGIEVGAIGGGDIDVTADRVSGTYGVYAVNQDGGATVRTNGAVTGTTGEGIHVFAWDSVRVEVADTVTGATDGANIVAGVGGSGDVSVTGAGGFVGLDGYGLIVENDGSGRVDIDISGAVVAGNGGVYVENSAIDSGDINVTTGDVTALGADYEGVLVISSSLDADVSITTNGDVVADGFGIAARLIADADGDIHVAANGSVTGEFGISAQNLGDGAIAVDAVGPITATDIGIIARSQGGDIIIDAGDVSATDNDAIFAWQQNAAGFGEIVIATTGAVSGVNGIRALNDGSGPILVDASGPITATENGIVAISEGGDITVAASNVSATDNYGVFAQQQNAAGAGNVDITTTGAISGRIGIGVRNDGSGATAVNTSGPITATDNGIDVESQGGDITIGAGDVSATTVGIFALQENAAGAGNIDIATTGAVSGDIGILGRNAGSGAVSVNASGPITAISGGIDARSQGGDIIIDAGDVSAPSVVGIFARQENAAGTGDIAIATTGAVTAESGIVAQNDGSGAVTVNADGPITALIGISALSQGGDITITADDVSATADFGVFALQQYAAGGGNMDITTTGAVSGVTAILAQNAGSGAVSVNASGPITGTESGVVAISAGGDVTVTAGDVSAIDAYGVFAWQENPAGAGDVAITTTGAVSGFIGIQARNDGSGASTVNASGPITATSVGIEARSQGGDITVAAGDVTATGDAIFARQANAAGTGDIAIATTGAVSGFIGIEALNDGSGAVSVDASGPITATEVGIVAQTEGGDITIAAGAVTAGGDVAVFAEQSSAAGAGDIDITTTGAVSGAVNGIEAFNVGSGAIRIAAGGTVTGTGGAGITAQGDAIDVTVAGLVSGGDYGMFLDGGAGGAGDISVTGAGGFAGVDEDAVLILNSGSGTVTYDVSGPVTSTNGSGVVVRDTIDGGDISVTTGAVTAAATDGNAIDVRGRSQTADVTIVANGALEAGTNGVLAFILDAAATGDIDVRTNGSVTAGVGINAQNSGAGGTTVTAVGPVAGTFVGIGASSNGGDVTVTAGDVAASGPAGIAAQIQNGGNGDVTVTAANVTGDTGILASNAGTGDIRITTTGTVTGSADGPYGIQAGNSANGGDVVIDANNVSGADAGIRVDNLGLGVTDLTVRGLVHGGPVGVSVYSDGDQDVRITNEGVIRSTAGLSSDRAIEASGGFIDFTNTGTLVGDINFQGDANVFDNQGTWNTVGGDSTFAGVDDELINAATGSILAGATAGTQEVTIFRGLETFHNEGRLTMGDNGAGDLVMTSADTVFAAGSLLQVDISGQNLADLFATTGTLTLEAGARLDVNFVQPLTLGGRWVVARADGGLTGTFDFEDRLLTAFVGLRDGYTTTTAYIEIDQLRALIEAGVTPNQRETGAAADSLPDTNPLKSALLLLPNDGAAQDAFDQLSGEIHPAARRAMVDDSRQFRDAVLDRLSDERVDGSIWGRALIEERITDADENAAKVEHDARGLIFGADRALTDNLTVGVAGGWFNTDLGVLQRNSTGSTQSQQALAYLGARMDRLSLRAGVGYARTSTDTWREIAFPGFSASPTADYDGSVLQGFVEAAWRLPLHGGYVEPFANLTAITADTDAFHEVDGPAALAVEARSESLTATTLGFRFQTDRTGALSLRGTAGWRNLSGDLEPAGRHAFDGGPTFTVLGAAQSDIAAVGALEAQWRLLPNVTLGAAWDGVFGNKGQDHAITGRLRIAF